MVKIANNFNNKQSYCKIIILNILDSINIVHQKKRLKRSTILINALFGVKFL